MQIEFLVEEPSAEIALTNLIPKIVGNEVSFNIHTFQGKSDLLSSLAGRLRGYSHWIPPDWRVVVLVDEDRQDCGVLKARMNQAATAAGLIAFSAAQLGRDHRVLNRIAIEELEAWFFGDVEAIVTAYPGVPKTLGNKAEYRDPDAIRGGTWESLQRVLQRAGYYRGGLPKTEAARKISMHMNPDRNRSQSFNVFQNALKQISRIQTESESV